MGMSGIVRIDRRLVECRSVRTCLCILEGSEPVGRPLTTIHAIFETGVFRPTEPVALADRMEVEFEPRGDPHSRRGRPRRQPFHFAAEATLDAGGNPKVAGRNGLGELRRQPAGGLVAGGHLR